jgi:NADPH:quinone reductase-like Zn-dependent oxidoreductase
MRAAVFDRYGPPEVLKVVDLVEPFPRPDQVRVRVRAAGVQPFDTYVRRGLPGFAARAFPQQLGQEFSGVVDRVGGTVRGWAVGDEVLGWTHLASHAEYVVSDAKAIVSKPGDMPWDVAGGLSSSGQTAYTALRALSVSAGETVLVHGAAGGVGTVAVQLARLSGARVIGTASAPHHGYLTGLGVTPVAYGPGLTDRVRALAPEGVDAVLDAVGGQALQDSLDLVSERGRIATLVDHDVAAELGMQGVRAVLCAAQLHDLVALHQAGALRILIRASFPLERIADAHRAVESHHGRGKVVVRIEGEG